MGFNLSPRWRLLSSSGSAGEALLRRKKVELAVHLLCGRRFPDSKEKRQIDRLRKRKGQKWIDEEDIRERFEYCVCPEEESGPSVEPSQWRRNPVLLSAALFAKYPNLYAGNTHLRKNRDDDYTARTIQKRINEWMNGKTLPDDNFGRKLRRFIEFGDRALFDQSVLFDHGMWHEKTKFNELLDNPLAEMIFGHSIVKPARIAEFLAYLEQKPLLGVALSFSYASGVVGFPIEDPHGYDPDGRKKKLYENNVEYQAILDGMDDCGYDEWLATLADYGFSPLDLEEADELDPGPFAPLPGDDEKLD